MLQHERFSVVFCDYNMPGMNGNELVSKFREWERFHRVGEPVQGAHPALSRLSTVFLSALYYLLSVSLLSSTLLSALLLCCFLYTLLQRYMVLLAKTPLLCSIVVGKQGCKTCS